MIWVSRALAAAIVLIGPALLAFARSDLGPWSSRPEQIFLAAPFALQALGAFGYVVAAAVTRADVSTTRTVIAAMGCLLIPYATMALASPLLAFLSVQGTKLALAAALAVLALPTAVFQVLTMGRKRPLAKLEFLSHPYATSGPFLFDSMLPLLEHGGGERIFQAWPVLLALAPFVALAAAGATAVPLRRLAFGCVVAAIPIYAGMTALHAGDGAAAALWPVRVWTDFIGTSERLALIRTVTTVRPGIPVRIGEHWYRFEHPGTQNAWPVNIRRPDRIAYLQLDIPAEDADLSELRNVGDRVQLNFLSTAPLPWGASSRSPEEIERGGLHIAVSDRDLTVYVVARNREVDRAEVRRKLTRFIQNARVEPPAK